MYNAARVTARVKPFFGWLAYSQAVKFANKFLSGASQFQHGLDDKKRFPLHQSVVNEVKYCGAVLTILGLNIFHTINCIQQSRMYFVERILDGFGTHFEDTWGENLVARDLEKQHRRPLSGKFDAKLLPNKLLRTGERLGSRRARTASMLLIEMERENGKRASRNVVQCIPVVFIRENLPDFRVVKIIENERKC